MTITFSWSIFNGQPFRKILRNNRFVILAIFSRYTAQFLYILKPFFVCITALICSIKRIIWKSFDLFNRSYNALAENDTTDFISGRKNMVFRFFRLYRLHIIKYT